MDEEIQMLQLDKPGQGKSLMELQKHSLDESFFEHKPVDRALYILLKGDEIQKLSVIGSLPDLLKCDKGGMVTKILPKIQQELPNASSEFSLAVSRMFNILMHMDIPVNLIPQVLQGIENKDPVIANAWMETLLSVIPVLKETTIKNDVLRCAVSKSQLSKAAYFRVSSCKMLGKISVHRYMNPFDVKKDVLPLVQSLCQDCFYEVRAAMCRELPFVAQGLSNISDSMVKVNLLPLLVELSADENVYVRAVAVESVVSIIPFLSPETAKGTIIPLAKKLCSRSVAEGDITYTSIAAVFSKLIGNLRETLTPSDAMWFLDYYNHICKKGLSLVEDLDIDPSVSMLCRENCARTLPRIAQMVLTDIPNEITSKWYQTFRGLAADPCYLVRKAVASCLWDIIQTLGTNNKIVMTDFTKLLRDEDEEVLQALVPNCAMIMDSFAVVGVLSRDIPVQATLDVGRAMLKCHNEVFKTNNWRMKESILKQWERLPNSFPSDFIHQHYTPVVLGAALTGKAKPVRSQAARTLLVILRYSLKENHRKWIREMINNQLCNSICCYSRQLFVRLCAHAIDIFSWKYFKEFFYLPLLSLAEDTVSIVRLCMVKLCPILRQMLLLPMDRALQLKLEATLTRMEMMESDKDVIRMLKLKLKEMRSFQINKSDVVLEEKRRCDEEEKIFRGKLPVFKFYAPTIESLDVHDKSSGIVAKSDVGLKQAPKRLNDGSSSTMSFLDQHFYIDAGVALPNCDYPSYKETSNVQKTSIDVNGLINSTENLTFNAEETSLQTDNCILNKHNDISVGEEDMVISVENINIESLTQKDLEALETTTTNITDDVKVNLQKISKEGTLRKRSKRNSCVFSSDSGRSAASIDASLKRRSLNITTLHDSKIPICSKATKRLSYSQRSKSVSDQTLDVTPVSCQKISGLPRFTGSSLSLRNKDEHCKNLDRSGFLVDSQIMTKSYKSDDEIVKKRSIMTGATDKSNVSSIRSSDSNAKLGLEMPVQNSNVNDNQEFPNTGDSGAEIVKIKEIRRRSSGLPVSIAKKPAK